MVFQHYVGVLLVLLMITAVGIYSGKKVTNATDFSTSGRAAGTGIVAGSLIGTLAGGASTIGTAQLAFSYGFSAWWFTMGGGIGLIVMALSFAKPLYCSGALTIAQIFEREYGRKVAITTALLMSIGTFLSITSQLLSGISLITSVSEISSPAAAMPAFILRHLPPLWGGIILAALLAALIGTGAGLALGMSSMFCGDIIKPCCKTSLSDAVLLRVQRRIIVVILASAGLFTFGNMVCYSKLKFYVHGPAGSRGLRAAPVLPVRPRKSGPTFCVGGDHSGTACSSGRKLCPAVRN